VQRRPSFRGLGLVFIIIWVGVESLISPVSARRYGPKSDENLFINPGKNVSLFPCSAWIIDYN
jgi:hypothetical protein